ncbi:MAG: aldose 1-epimerase family protein [Halieaceae bacterium]|nr:aldose 1-epimerase family protein [Halieaceae bacterium]
MTSSCDLSNDHLSLSVASMGAEMQYLRTAAGADLLWNGDPAFWTGRAPVLFPIVGKAVNDTIAVGAHEAQMPQHGFARRCDFSLEEQSTTRCHHVLRPNDKTRAAYPFEFALHISHELNNDTLTVSARVENHSSRPMPFGFGFHPAFRWPLPGSDASKHSINLETKGAPKQRPLRPDGLLERDLVRSPFDNGELEITEPLFAHGALVFPNGSDDLIFSANAGPKLAFRFHNLPDLALWKLVGAPFLCIEPWHGTASLVGDGPQIGARPNSLVLEPDVGVEFGYSVTVTP